MSRLSSLAAQLRDFAARAAAHSSPVHLSQVLAEGFTVLADLAAEAQKHADDVFASFAQLPLTPGDRDALTRAGLLPDLQEFAHGVAIGAQAVAAADQAQPDAHLVETAVSERELAALATAPRVTQADVDANIVGAEFFTAGPQSVLTICVLTLRNGFTVTGESACASPENFDAAIGQRLARENAVRKIWPLMGYELRSKLASPPVTADQVIDAGPRGIELASALHGLSAEEFDQAVTNARAILFGQVAG